MQFEVGKPIFLDGEWYDIKTRLYSLSSELQKRCRKILIVDTMNSINPHHFAYNHVRQEDVFNNIYCVRCPKAYDLWARMQSMEGFLRKKQIEALIITSLNLVFSDNEEKEVVPLLQNIMAKVTELTKKYHLITIIGKSPSDDLPSKIAYDQLSAIEIPMVR